MRIPGVKIWRAFKELDHLTDSECQSLIIRAYLQVSPWQFRFLSLLATVLAFAATGGVAFTIRGMFERGGMLSIGVVILVCSLVFFVAIFNLLARDIHLYRLIRRDITRASCPKCRQSLMGLPITQTALHPGTPGDAKVRCPECGREWVLMEIGLNSRDLIPFEQRMPDERIGTIRHGANWKGRRG